MKQLFCVLSLAVSASQAFAQSGQTAPGYPHSLSLSGPRFGVTMLSEGVIKKLEGDHMDIKPMVSQFGWQIERQFYNGSSGVTALNEWVGLIGGLDQGVAIPSVSWLVGLRTKEGAEFGIGPNVTPAGVALAIAAGVTFRAGVLNVPMNVAVIPTRAGTRLTVLTGFTLRR